MSVLPLNPEFTFPFQRYAYKSYKLDYSHQYFVPTINRTQISQPEEHIVLLILETYRYNNLIQCNDSFNHFQCD